MYPFDDYHRYHRPAALVAQFVGGGDIKQKLQWLAPEPVAYDFPDSDMRTLSAFGLKPPKG
jgi:hypothetical protein